MNILVTGGSGYVGSSFINAFKDKYTFVKFSLLKNSLSDMQLENIDVVLHCAALVHQKSEHSYEQYYKTNVEYPLTVAKKAKEHEVKHFIFISTIAVYGKDKVFINGNTECKPITPYGKSKLEAEQQLKALEDETFTVSIIRPPMVYGEKAPGNIASLIKLIKQIPILPFAQIDNKRSFIYVGNLVYLINKVIEKKQSGIFLASDDEPLSTTHLIESIAGALDKKVHLVKVPFFETFLKLVKPSFHQRLFGSLEVDNSQTKKLLGLKNPYSTEEGIKYMIHGEKI